VRSIFVVPAAIGAIALIVASVVLYRRKYLSARYFVGWVAVGASLGIGSLVLALVHQKVGSEVLTASAISVGLLALLGLLVQLSISVSGLQRQLRQVAQAVALMSTTSHREPQRTAADENDGPSV
jgi:Uncharacterized conserved protein (DUF2304)